MLDKEPPAAQERGPDDDIEEALRGEDDSPPSASLLDDVFALVDDGKTYFEAEVAYQKTRIAYTAGETKSAALLVLAAFAFIHLALIALVVGAVIALTPALTALGATAVVVAVLLVATIIVLMLARRRARNISRAFADEEQ